jgi:hypothetical protein
MNTLKLPDIPDLWLACRTVMAAGDVDGIRAEFHLYDIAPDRANAVVDFLAGLRVLAIGTNHVPVAHSGEALPYRDAFLAREVERDQIDLVIHRQEILIELLWIHDGSTLDVEIHPWAEDLFESRGLTPSRLFLSVHALLRQLIDTAQPKRGLFLLEDAQFDESSDPAWRDRLVFLDRTAIG